MEQGTGNEKGNEKGKGNGKGDAKGICNGNGQSRTSFLHFFIWVY